MPGNKRQGEFNQLDFTEVEDLDNLYHPEGIYKESLDRIKNLYSTKESYILVNGSTVGILSAITGCAKKGGNILMARNCHKSVYNAVENLEDESLYIEDLQPGDQFIYRKQRYLLEEKRKKNYLCNNLENGKKYIFRPLARVEKLN